MNSNVNVVVSGHHFNVSPRLRTQVDEKLRRLRRHFDRLTEIQCILSTQKSLKRAEATIHLRGNIIFAHASAEDMRTALDRLYQKLDRQLLKHKEKITNHNKRQKAQ